MGTHLQTVHHHEVDVVHVTLVGEYLLLHLGQVFFQVNLDIVEPGAKSTQSISIHVAKRLSSRGWEQPRA